MKLMIIDALNLIHRNYHAVGPLMTSGGVHSGAVYGTAKSILSAVSLRRPDFLCVALDLGGRVFRHDKYPQYKEGRSKSPEELKSQIPLCLEMFGKMGIKTFGAPGFEADDVIGTLAAGLASSDLRVEIFSSDKDFCQLVSDHVTLVRPRGGGVIDEMDRTKVEETYGIRPDQFVEYLALVGDTSDNVPGVKGIGEKTASKLLAEYGSLAGVVENIDKLPIKLAEKIRSGLDDLELSLDLVTMADSGTKVNLDELRTPTFKGADLADFYRKMEFRLLAEDASR
jgi:DNA polymerase-1